jgi:hypothetical protein
MTSGGIACLLAALSREALSPPQASDWTPLPPLAQRHGCVKPALDALASRPDVPGDVRRALHDLHRRNVVGALQGTADLRSLVQALDGAGIRAVALKGPAHAAWLHGDPFIRPFADLDLLVAPGDRRRAADTLAGLGYMLPDGMSRATADVIYGALGAWPLARAGALPVDLHWRLAHVRFPNPVMATDVLSESGSLRLQDTSVRIPSPTHAALLSLLHGAKHLWCALDLVVGVAAVARRTDVDWGRVRALARRGGAWNACVTGLRLARDLLGAPVPLDDPALAGASSGRAVRDAVTMLEAHDGPAPGTMAERRMHHAALDTAWLRARDDAWRLLAPTPLEWRWVRLPERLRYLYVPLRLVRLGASALRPHPFRAGLPGAR